MQKSPSVNVFNEYLLALLLVKSPRVAFFCFFVSQDVSEVLLLQQNPQEKLGEFSSENAKR